MGLVVVDKDHNLVQKNNINHRNKQQLKEAFSNDVEMSEINEI